MARTNDKYEEKRSELLKNLWEIFMKNGYENTTLALIIKELGISKGAFYHYFTTKEACADAAIQLFVRKWAERVGSKIEGGDKADIKFNKLLASSAQLAKENEVSIKAINAPNNAVFHQKLMAALVKELAPLYAEVIQQGNDENVFKAEYPLETAQMFLTLTNFYFDQDLFGWNENEMGTKITAFKSLFTSALKAESNIFEVF